MEIQIWGLAEVQKRLLEAPSLLVSKAFYQALDRAAGVLAAEVETRAPIGEEALLKESVIVNVKVEAGSSGGSAAVGFASTRSDRTGKPADLIALWVEYGHRIVTHEGKATGKRVPANPFMRRALNSAGDRAIEAFGNTLLANLNVVEK